MSNEENETAEERANLLECFCELCGQNLKGKTLPLLELVYRLHKRDHELEEERTRNRVKLVRSGSGWILTNVSPPSIP